MDDVAAPWIAPQRACLPSSRGDIDVLQISLGGVPRGAVIVLCAAGALHRDGGVVMNRLAAQGYESIAADGGDGGQDDLLDRVGAALTRLARRGWSGEQVGLIGYGAGGGPAALVAAMRASMGAAVSVAPVWAGEPASALRSAARSAPQLRTPWLGLFGEGDIHGAAAQALGDALAARAPVFAQLVVYPGVAGAFYLDGAQAAVHAAAYDSWQRTAEWLNLRVVPRLTPRAEAWRFPASRFRRTE